MNLKFGLVMGAAVACAVMAGCKAPKAQTSGGTTTMEPTRPRATTTVTTVDEKPQAKPFVKESKPAHCTCPPGTVHESPCMCGAPDCKCKVKAPEPEYTEYRVKGGDMLSAICKRYGVKQRDVIKLNPGLNPNRLIAGKKIKLPGVIDLKEGDAQQGAAAKPATGGKAAADKKAGAAGAKPAADKKGSARATSYKGATKEYVVKNGDFLGKIAADHGVTVKCLKEMNGLKNNNIRIGQKLKVPAEKPVAAEKKDEPKKDDAAAAAAKPVEGKDGAKAAEGGAQAQPSADVEPKVVEEKKADGEQAAAGAAQVNETATALESAPASGPLTHTVKEGEDIVSIAIMYNVSPSSILDLNGLTNGNPPPPGTVLKLPPNAKKQ